MIKRVEAAAFMPIPLAGIGLALLAFSLFTVMDVTVKLLGSRYPLVQIMFFNSACGLAVNLVVAHLRGGIARVRTTRPRLHLARWAISFCGTFAVFHAYTLMPIADVYAVLFASPLLITALSVPLLGEHVGMRRWCAILAGFGGVLVMLRPGGDGFDAVMLFAVFGAVAHAGNMLLVRKMSATELPESLGVYGNIFTCAVTGPMLVLLWVTPSGGDLALLMLAGTIAGSGFCLLATAFRHAAAGLVAPFQYCQMPLGLAVGWLLFSTVPQPQMLLGATIVIASGLYTIRREARAGRATGE